MHHSVKSLVPALLGVACLAGTAGAVDPAPHYAPYLQDMRVRLEALLADLASPATPSDAARKAALERSLAALDRPSASMREDLDVLARAVAPLWGPYRRDEGMRALVQYEMNLYWARLEEREVELETLDRSAMRRESGRLSALESANWRRAKDGTPWTAVVRRIAKAARLLDDAAARLEVSPEYAFAEGTVTATLDGAPRTWRVVSAYVTSNNFFELRAYSLEPYTMLKPVGLFDPKAGDAYPKAEQPSVGPPAHAGIALFEAPDLLRDSARPGVCESYSSTDDATRSLTLDSFDTTAGTAAGTFSMTLGGCDGTTPRALTGSFEIESGLVRYRRR